MNKSFKVVFNKARGALMVVNEVTSSVQAKGTKTVIAAAVSTLMISGGVAAELPNPITNTNLPKLELNGTSTDTSKLISGKGEAINIQTNGSVGDFLSSINDALGKEEITDKIKGLYGSLQPSNGNVILTGVTGGNNLMDKATAKDADWIGKIASVGLDTPNLGDKLISQFGYSKKVSTGTFLPKYEYEGSYFDGSEAFVTNQSTNIQIGGDKSNPLVLGVVGGDLLLSLSGQKLSANRTGISNIKISSGNVAGVVGGNASIGLAIGAPLQGSLSSTIKASNLTIDGTANVGGFIGGNLAIGTNKNTVISSVTEGSTIKIDLNEKADPSKPDGLVIGGVAGGLAFGSGQGTASVNNGKYTDILINNGEVIGLIGGGAAVSWDFGSPILNLVTGVGSSETNSTSGDIKLIVSEGATTIGMIGAGVAVSDAFSSNVGKSVATANSVSMTFNGSKSGLTEEQKQQLHGAVNKVPELIKEKELDKLMAKIPEITGDLDIDGVHIGNLGGGLAFARSQYEIADGVTKGSSTAISKVGDVVMTFNGGYNVATAAGGLAITHDLDGFAEEEQGISKATAEVGSTTININGGENILVTAGGMAAGFASSGLNSATLAETKVNGKATVNVNGGSVDGLFGGGIALDDTAASKTNATTYVNNVVLNVQGGTVNVANIDPIKGIIGSINHKIGVPEYVLETAEIVGKNHGKVAILGGGMATGAGANATADAVNINLTGGKVVGNVVAGGVATMGGTSLVKNAQVTVNGSSIEGDIYGGGLAGNVKTDYEDSKSTVTEVTIALNSGSLKGNVLLGSPDLQLAKEGKTTVGTGTVKLNGAFDFQGEKIDGSGADKATLVITGDVDLAKKTETASLFTLPKNVVIGGFDNIDGEKGSLKNADFEFGNKANTTITGGQFDFVNVIDGDANKILTLDQNAAVAITSTAANNFVVTNGVLGLGTDAKAKDAAIAKASQATEAALYLSGTVELVGKNIKVGKTDKTGVVIGKNGTLIVDATVSKGETANETSQPVTTVTGTVEHEEGAKLHFVNVADQGVVQVDTGITNITVDNILFEATEVAGNKYTFGVTKDQGKLDSLGVGDFNTGALQQIAGQKDEASEFINGFMNGQTGVALSGADRNAKLKSAFNLGAAAGVQTAGIDSALMGIDEATKRASLTNVFNDGWTGFASVTGNQLKFGDSSDALETKTKLAGVAVGGEYTMGDMTFGALGHFGSGDVKGQGRNSGVKNDVDYYGFQAYAAKRINQFNVVGQLGYVMTKNDITHDVGQSTKVDADVFTMGVRGEMNYAINDTWNAVPYVGLNWLRVSTDAYTTNKGIRVDSTDQDLINMPIGVAISGDCSNVAGWTVRPVVDVAYVHTFGDTDLDATSHVGEAAMGTTLDVWSENVGRFSVGAEARNGNMGFGFKLGGAKGDGGHEEFFGQLNAKYVF